MTKATRRPGGRSEEDRSGSFREPGVEARLRSVNLILS